MRTKKVHWILVIVLFGLHTPGWSALYPLSADQLIEYRGTCNEPMVCQIDEQIESLWEKDSRCLDLRPLLDDERGIQSIQFWKFICEGVKLYDESLSTQASSG